VTAPALDTHDARLDFVDRAHAAYIAKKAPAKPARERGSKPGLELVLSASEQAHRAVVDQLRAEALATYNRLGRAISTNDIRDFFEGLGYDGDRRVLGLVFEKSKWECVGTEPMISERSHAGRFVKLWRLK
jgi:hypothetical protein